MDELEPAASEPCVRRLENRSPGDGKRMEFTKSDEIEVAEMYDV